MLTLPRISLLLPLLAASLSAECPSEPTIPGVSPLIESQDYGFLYWPGNHWYSWGTYETERYVQTGFYGLGFDVASGSLTHLGPLEAALSPDASLRSEASLVSDLPLAQVTYFAGDGTQGWQATDFLDVGGSANNPSRLIDMGRFMQHIDIPRVEYGGGEGPTGSIELAAMPRHFVLTQRVLFEDGIEDGYLEMAIGGEALAQFPTLTWLEEGRALSLLNDDGEGWFVILEGAEGVASTLEVEPGGGLVFRQAGLSLAPGEGAVMSVVAIPARAAQGEALGMWLNPEASIQVEYAQLNRDGSGGEALTQANWDPARGLYVVELGDMADVGGGSSPNWNNPDIHNWYNRHRLVVRNPGTETVSVPIAFDGGGNAAYYIVGGSPMLRDTDGEPTGVPIQISKNWHDPPAWYHLYTTLEVEPGDLELEHTFAHSKWGNAFAAAHAQLSLIGWGVNQQWDESSLGAFGESITYDPDFTLGRAMVDDVRPFLVDASGEWRWTGNVGGANFLVYDPADITTGWPEHQLGRLRTHYNQTGPNLTEVIYAGITADERIEGIITTHLGRTDDCLRVYYTLDYRVLEDVTYDRFALFQMAADRYGDNGFTRFAYGNEVGVPGDGEILDHGTTGYASEADRGIRLPGASPWVMLHQSTKTGGNLPEHLANVAFVIREYRMTLGDQVLTTPHINIIQTNNGQSQVAFELGLPFEGLPGVIPGGSRLQATVEYVIPPSEQSAYYGPSDYLTAMDPEDFNTPEMAITLAAGNTIRAGATTGRLMSTYPLTFRGEAEETAVAFWMEGGLGFSPVVVKGLPRPDGWVMEREGEDGTWQELPQAVEGKDYWQAHTNVEGGDFELSFNIPNQGLSSYRLRRRGEGE